MNSTNKNHKWLILAAMTFALGIFLIDQSVSIVTLPRLQRALSVSDNNLAWIINSYMLAMTAVVAVCGSFGDIFGRVKLYVLGVLLFAVSCLLISLSTTVTMLMIFRVIQGIGAALFMPASATIVNTSFDFDERGKAMAIYTAGSIIFMLLGSVFGGMLTDYLSWRWAYRLVIPIAVVAVILVLYAKPADEINKEKKIDIAGTVLLFISAVSVVLSIQQGAVWGWNSSLTLTLLFGGLIVFGIFVFVENKVQEPIIDFHLLANRNYTANLTTLACIQFVTIGQGIFGAIYLQNILGFSPTVAGLWATVTVIVMAVFSQYGGKLFDKIGIKVPAVLGLIIVAFSYFWQGPLLVYQNIYYLLPGIIGLGIGLAFVQPPSYTDALNHIEEQSRGQAAGVIENLNQIGGTLGISIMAVMVNSLQLLKIKEVVVAAGVEPEKASVLYGILSETAKVQQTRASSISADWQGIIQNVKIAVTNSIASTYYLAGIIMTVCLIIAVFALKKGRQING